VVLWLEGRDVDVQIFCGEGIYPRWTAQQSPKAGNSVSLIHRVLRFGTAAQSSGDKSPRHKGLVLCQGFRCGEGINLLITKALLLGQIPSLIGNT